MEHLERFAEPSTLVCPDCGGALWEVKEARPPRFRCHTGHAFTLRSLAHTMNEATEEALQTAMRALQEQAILLRRAAHASRASGALEEASALEAGAEEADTHARTIRDMVEKPAIQPLERDLANDS
jgi:two-component system chemotaxis response regulator CheB